MPIKYIFLILLLIGSNINSAELAQLESMALSGVIGDIEIICLNRTDVSVVQRELTLSAESEQENNVKVAVQQLKNLRIFSQVKPDLKNDKNKNRKLSLALEEKWTTIPVMKFSSGGGTNYFVVGVYDINSFGKYLELGAQYENWNGENAGVVWFRNPRFLGQRLKFSTDVWSVKRPEVLYVDAEEAAHYVLDRKKINIGLEKELNSWFKLGMGIELNSDKFIGYASEPGLSTMYTDQLLSGESSDASFGRLSIGLGKINYDNYLVSGSLLELNFDKGFKVQDSEHDHTRVNADVKSYWRLPYKANVAFRLLAGATSSQALQHIYSVGGFENVRGYFDGQFRGRAFWQSNVEFRIPSYHSNWFVLQHNFFADIAQVKQTFGDLSLDGSDTYASAGLGIRFNSPKIYRFTARLDFVAWTSDSGSSSLSFGVQQFF